jgi:hypothetical protein
MLNRTELQAIADSVLANQTKLTNMVRELTRDNFDSVDALAMTRAAQHIYAASNDVESVIRRLPLLPAISDAATNALANDLAIQRLIDAMPSLSGMGEPYEDARLALTRRLRKAVSYRELTEAEKQQIVLSRLDIVMPPRETAMRGLSEMLAADPNVDPDFVRSLPSAKQIVTGLHGGGQ